MFTDTILSADDRRFLLLEKIKKSAFKSEDAMNTALQGIVHLIRPNDEYVYFVEEIMDAKYVDIQEVIPEITAAKESKKKELKEIQISNNKIEFKYD